MRGGRRQPHALAGFRHGCESALRGKGARGLVSAQHCRGRVAGAAAALFYRGRRRLPRAQDDPRALHFFPAQSARRPAVFARGPHLVPESAHLSGAGFAAAAHAHLPLRAESRRLAAARQFRVGGDAQHAFRSGGFAAQNLHAARGRPAVLDPRAESVSRRYHAETRGRGSRGTGCCIAMRSGCCSRNTRRRAWSFPRGWRSCNSRATPARGSRRHPESPAITS